MKLEIELDLNKIDYVAINKQIADKIAELNIKETHELRIETRIEDAINREVSKLVDSGFNTYIANRHGWNGPITQYGKNLIDDISRTEIETRAKSMMDEFFTEERVNELREIMMKMIPNVFAHIMFSRLESSLYNTDYDYRNKMMSIMRSEIEHRINNMSHHF